MMRRVICRSHLRQCGRRCQPNHREQDGDQKPSGPMRTAADHERCPAGLSAHASPARRSRGCLRSTSTHSTIGNPSCVPQRTRGCTCRCAPSPRDVLPEPTCGMIATRTSAAVDLDQRASSGLATRMDTGSVCGVLPEEICEHQKRAGAHSRVSGVRYRSTHRRAPGLV